MPVLLDLQWSFVFFATQPFAMNVEGRPSFPQCELCLAGRIIDQLRQWQADRTMGRWLIAKDIWESVHEVVHYQIGVDPDVVLSDCWSRWFFRRRDHAFTKHSDYCYEVKEQIIYYG